MNKGCFREEAFGIRKALWFRDAAVIVECAAVLSRVG